MGHLKLLKASIASLPRPGRPSVPSVHESGHAVARFLTAARCGIAPKDAVQSIEMRLGGGTTFGPMFTVDVAQAADRAHARYSTDGTLGMPPHLQAIFRERPEEYMSLVLTEARNSNADIANWLEIKMTQYVAGPLAEALYLKRNLAQVLKSDACRADVASIASFWNVAASLLPYLAENGWKQRIAPISRVLGEQFSEPATWTGLLAVAQSLPLMGKMEGRKAWEIFSKAQHDFQRSPETQRAELSQAAFLRLTCG